MNILFVTDDNLLNSVVYDIHILAEGLSLLGHQVFVVDSKRGQPTSLQTIETKLKRVYLDSRACLIHAASFEAPYLGTLVGTFFSYQAIKKAIIEKKIDVIILYSVVRTGWPTIRLAKKYGVPVIFRNIDMLHKLLSSSLRKKTMKLLEQFVYQKTDYFLALSPRYVAYLNDLGAVSSRIQILPFPLDIQRFRPSVDTSTLREKWGIQEHDRVIIYMGQLYTFCGLDEFLDYFPRVVQVYPEAKLMIVGDGPLRGTLEQKIQQLGLEKRVVITGLQPFEDMSQYINLAQIGINTYPVTGEMRDLFCAKVIQYLACGKPTVSNALPGMTTMLKNEVSGVIYADSLQEMVEAINRLLESDQRREMLGNAGLAYVSQTHRADQVVHQLEDFLNAVLHGTQEMTSVGL